MDAGEEQARPQAEEKAEPGLSGQDGAASRGKGRDQHLALQPDVENPGALGVEPGEAGEKQGGRQAEGGIQDLDQAGVIHHLGPLAKSFSRGRCTI